LKLADACAIVVKMGRVFVFPIVAIAGACHLAFPIEQQQQADASTSPDSPQGPRPRVWSSPGPASSYYKGYPANVTVTLAADDPSTTIYYTTDGSPPDTSSPGSKTPATGIPLSSTTNTLRYVGVNAAGPGDPSTDNYAFDAAAADQAGFLVTEVTLDDQAPVREAAPGAVLTARANIRFWVQQGYSSTAQLVYGVDTIDQGCLYDGQPGTYPGYQNLGHYFDVTAPSTPGVYEVRVAHIEDVSCAVARTQTPLFDRPRARIGVIIVR
jgi:hypothetical protein